MELHYCDVCHQVLSGDIYILVLTKFPALHPGDKKFFQSITVEEYYQKLQNHFPASRRNTEIKEICEPCSKVLSKLFSMRLAKLKLMQKQIEKIQEENWDD